LILIETAPSSANAVSFFLKPLAWVCIARIDLTFLTVYAANKTSIMTEPT